MSTIKRYKVLVLGVVCLALVLLATRKPKEPDPEDLRSRLPVGMTAAVPAAHEGGAGQTPAEEAPGADQAGSAPDQSAHESPAETAAEAEAEAQGETVADTARGEETEIDLEEVRGKALAEVRRFEQELATTLWTFNPNARKTRLKAAQLKDRAENIEQWVRKQDDRTDLSPEESREWAAQRDVWLDHARDLKEVSNRLTKSHGTRRRVRNIAREMQGRLDAGG